MNEETEDEYVEKLEEALSRFMSPMDDIPFEIVVRGIYGYRVREFQPEEEGELLEQLERAAEIAAENAREEGIFRSRRNEVGNDMEEYVTEGLSQQGIVAETPTREDGKKQSTGYPDLYFEDGRGRPFYYEVKSYNPENIETTQRSFYMSPPDEGKSKVTEDAYHLAVSFEIHEDERRGDNRYYPKAWKIIKLRGMSMEIKNEIHSSNRELYEDRRIISEGSIN